MIFYDYIICEEARVARDTSLSEKTGKEFTYTYYIELIQKYRNRTLDDNEYFDFEVSQFKYDLNRK